MTEEARCSPGTHDYLPPVVVRCERRGVYWLLLIFGDSSRYSWEKAVTFCRRCGRMVAFGWQPVGVKDMEADEQ